MVIETQWYLGIIYTIVFAHLFGTCLHSEDYVQVNSVDVGISAFWCGHVYGHIGIWGGCVLLALLWESFCLLENFIFDA